VASQTPSVTFQRKRRSLSAGQIFVAALVVLVILFLWLHLILALGIEATGRQIQTKTAELERTRRQILDRRQKVAQARSLEILASRARELGYQPQVPIYLLLLGPAGQPTSDVGGGEMHLPGTVAGASGAEASALETLSLWVALAQRLDTSMETETGPMP
jgi:hypothetical protein